MTARGGVVNFCIHVSRKILNRVGWTRAVEFVDLPRVATDGKGLSEAIEEAIGALGSDLSLLTRREEIPAPSRAKQRNV